MTEVTAFIHNDLPRIAGKMAVDAFRNNFRSGGFIDASLKKWEDVKRRDPDSGWYGFQYKGEKKGDKKGKQKYNFSTAATSRGVLIGPGAALMNSIQVREASSSRVVIASDLPYSDVQNEGGTIKVFGKATAELPARQFMGESKKLMEDFEKELFKRLDTIFDKL